MSNIISIAERKVQNEMDRLLEEMAGELEAMLRKHSAEGILRSGNTIRQAMNLVGKKSEVLRDVVIKHSQWVVTESIYVPIIIAEELVSISDSIFNILMDESRPVMKRATEVSGQPNLFARVYPDVEESINRSSGEARLEIEAIVASNRSRGVKGAAKFVFSGLSKLWGA
ncbi:hypothetical protein [uncultured Microbulbifer sp.]|uniref:hypothetical protein n=1 Tax=uncultured Microbulbifer sp. TaxID=348147 RepID=UPI0026284B71|nr:hypothetical protein [uncultured Microbulbifer sp.]